MLAQINDDLLYAGQLNLAYTVSAGESTAQSARQRLDRLCAQAMQQHLTGLLDSLRPAGDGLWFIRRLEFSADIDLELDDRDIMRNWSCRLARNLQQHLLDGSGDQVMYFPDYATYLGSFVADLAAGSGGKTWYYQTPHEEFAGLRSLPVPQAIVTALLRDSTTGMRAILSLPRADRARVLNALNDAGARRVLEGFAVSSNQQVTAEECLDVMLTVIQQDAPLPLLVSEQPWLETLECYLRAVEQYPGTGGQILAAIILAVITLRIQAASTDAEAFARLSQALLHNNTAAIFRLLMPAQAERLQVLSGFSRREKKRLLQALLPDKRTPGETSDSAEPRYTPFGGAFLLLPILQSLPLQSWLQNWPDPPAGKPAAVIRLMLLSKSQGHAVAGQVFRDPLIRDLCGVPPALDMRQSRDWLATIPARYVAEVQALYANWRLEASGADSAMLKQCPFAKRRLAVISETQRSCWLLLHGFQPSKPAALQRYLARMLPEDIELSRHEDAGCLLDDLQYLQLPSRLSPCSDARWLLTSMAQGMLRDFAWRLPGFAHSSLSHLRYNFLAVEARVEMEAERWLVRLGRPALNVVLAMTGLARGTHMLDWLDQLRLELYQGD